MSARGGWSAKPSRTVHEEAIRRRFVHVLTSSLFDLLRSLVFVASSSRMVRTQVSDVPWQGRRSASPKQMVRTSQIFAGRFC
jgi:hypothetical protein